MTATFNARLLECQEFVELRSRYLKLQTSVSNSETRLTTLEQNHQSIVEHYNERMKSLSTELKEFQGELHACNNRIKILEQKLLLTSVHIEPIQDSCPDFTETGSCSNDDLQLDKVYDEAAATTDEPKRPEIVPTFKKVKIIGKRLNIMKLNSTTSDEQENTLREADKESCCSGSDPDMLPLGDPNTAGTDSLLPQDIKPIVCPICQTAIGSETDLQSHTKSHLLLFECVLCDASFSAKEDFNKHVTEVHAPARKTFACSKCDLTFKYKHMLKSHNMRFKNIHSGNGYTCSICNITFNYHKYLQNHLRTHHGQRPKGLSCPKCTTSFSLKHDLIKHLRSHSNRSTSTTREIHSCELCPSKYIHRRSLQSHLLKIHGKSNPERLFACPVDGCELEFGLKAQLSAHLVHHRNESNHEDKLGSQDFTDFTL